MTNDHVIQHTTIESRRALTRIWIETPDGIGRLCVGLVERRADDSDDEFDRRVEDAKKNISSNIAKFFPPVAPRHDVLYALLIALRRWKAYAKVHENRDVADESSSEGEEFRRFANIIEKYMGLNSAGLVRLPYPADINLFGPEAEEYLKKKKAGFGYRKIAP